MEITLEAWEGRSLPLPPRAHGPWIFIPWWVLLLFYAGVLLLLHWLGGWRWVGLFSIGLTIGFFFYTSWECRATYYEALEHGLMEGMKFAHGRSWEVIEAEASRIYSASFGKPEWRAQKYFLVAVENVKEEMKR